MKLTTLLGQLQLMPLCGGVRGEPGRHIGQILLVKLWCCIAEHANKPVDLFRSIRIANVAIATLVLRVGTVGAHNKFAVYIEHRQPGNALTLSTDRVQEVHAAGSIGVLCVALVLTCVHRRKDKGAAQDRMHLRVGEKVLIEPAVTAPGSTELQQDVLVLGAGLGLGFTQNVCGRGRCVRRGGRERKR